MPERTPGAAPLVLTRAIVNETARPPRRRCEQPTCAGPPWRSSGRGTKRIQTSQTWPGRSSSDTIISTFANSLNGLVFARSVIDSRKEAACAERMLPSPPSRRIRMYTSRQHDLAGFTGPSIRILRSSPRSRGFIRSRKALPFRWLRRMCLRSSSGARMPPQPPRSAPSRWGRARCAPGSGADGRGRVG